MDVPCLGMARRKNITNVPSIITFFQILQGFFFSERPTKRYHGGHSKTNLLTDMRVGDDAQLFEELQNVCHTMCFAGFRSMLCLERS